MTAYELHANGDCSGGWSCPVCVAEDAEAERDRQDNPEMEDES